MIGTQVLDTEGVASAILGDRFDLSGYGAFIERQLGTSLGHASDRFVDHFIDRLPAVSGRGDTVPRDVRHE
jgi:hypothetical protein